MLRIPYFCILFFFFFCQPEDGIRDRSRHSSEPLFRSPQGPLRIVASRARYNLDEQTVAISGPVREIGRASWRERGEISGGAGYLKKKKKKKRRHNTCTSHIYQWNSGDTHPRHHP